MGGSHSKVVVLWTVGHSISLWCISSTSFCHNNSLVSTSSTVVELGTTVRVIVGSNPSQSDVASAVVRSSHSQSSSLQTTENKSVQQKESCYDDPVVRCKKLRYFLLQNTTQEVVDSDPDDEEYDHTMKESETDESSSFMSSEFSGNGLHQVAAQIIGTER